MQAGIRITADEIFPPNLTNVAPHEWDDGHEVGTLGLDSIHVSGPGEADANGDEYEGAKWECNLCHQRLREDGSAIEDGATICHQAPEDDGPHEAEAIPHSWLNSAGVTVDRDDNTVMVRISVGDPRGAFVMRVERVRYHNASADEWHDELRLAVPHPDNSMPHMTLEPLASPGYYRIKD